MDKVDVAASSIQEAANRQLAGGLSGVAVHPLDNPPPIQECVNQWAANVFDQNALPFKIQSSSLQIPNIRFSAFVFRHRRYALQKVTWLPVADATKCIIIIALADLTMENGLPRWMNGPAEVKKGEWTFFRGDQTHDIGEIGGGIGIYIELKINEDT